jgi:hypothetical protein
MSRARGQQGRFIPKSDAERRVRTLRATDGVWQAFGQHAEAQDMTRADLLEQWVQQLEQAGSSQSASVIEHPIQPVEPTLTSKASTAGSTQQQTASTRQTQYYLQLSYRTQHRREQWYWDGSELIPKGFQHPKHQAKVYDSKAAALSAAKKLQKHVDQLADRVQQPVELLSLKPVRVTW